VVVDDEELGFPLFCKIYDVFLVMLVVVVNVVVVGDVK
jgi:hypothetical protein